jgi:phage shock protein E
VLQKSRTAPALCRNLALLLGGSNKFKSNNENNILRLMGFFGLFGHDTSAEVKEMLQRGAVVIDVRTRAEFQGGHVAGSKNYPLQEIHNKVDELKRMGKPLVLCCQSGARSGQATGFLKSRGIECENGGGWMQVNAMTR